MFEVEKTWLQLIFHAMIISWYLSAKEASVQMFLDLIHIKAWQSCTYIFIYIYKYIYVYIYISGQGHHSVQLIACCLFEAKLDQSWLTVSWTLRNILQWNLDQNKKNSDAISAKWEPFCPDFRVWNLSQQVGEVTDEHKLFKRLYF